jgi:hypothetical protein
LNAIEDIWATDAMFRKRTEALVDAILRACDHADGESQRLGEVGLKDVTRIRERRRRYALAAILSGDACEGTKRLAEGWRP